MRSVPSESAKSLCPFDCSNGHGECPSWAQLLEGDPGSTSASQSEPSWIGIDAVLRCLCANTTSNDEPPEYAGRYCEASLAGINRGNLGPLRPGEWRAHQYNVGDGDPVKLSVELTVMPPVHCCSVLDPMSQCRSPGICTVHQRVKTTPPYVLRSKRFSSLHDATRADNS